MDVTDAHTFRVIDREIGDHDFSPAQYEILRCIIRATADFEYRSLIRFSAQALRTGADTLARGTAIVVDVPLLQVAITPSLQGTFSNPVYSSLEKNSISKGNQAKVVLGFETLARQHPDGIFVVGQNFKALLALIKLAEAGAIHPSFIISTPPIFLHPGLLKERFENLAVPHIRISGRKGNPAVAAAIFNGLVNLAWSVHKVRMQSD